MATSRGALIVFEGCDRVGKSTQCRKLVDALTSSGRKVRLMKFPDHCFTATQDRGTVIGKQIDEYLRCKVELHDAAVHLLFAANRWEMVPEINKHLLSGTTLVVDRYAFSGVAYTAAKKVAPMSWCKAPDVGLPAPDVVFYLTLSPEAAQKRDVYGSERYEKITFQQQVAKEFEQLVDSEWCQLDAARDIESLHSEVLATAVKVIDSKTNTPIGKLWTDSDN